MIRLLVRGSSGLGVGVVWKQTLMDLSSTRTNLSVP